MLKIPVDLLEEPEFTKWLTTAEARLWMKLVVKVVSYPNKKTTNKVPTAVYEKYYTKGKLATSWALSTLAKELNYGSSGKSNMSRLVKKLEEKNFIKKKKIMVDGTDYTVYELGRVNKTEHTDSFYAFEHFYRIINKKKVDSFKCGHEKDQKMELSD